MNKSKAVLVMDMPEKCNKCPCMKTLGNGAYCTKDMENYRHIDFAGRELGIDKPDWCPLISEPERQLNSAQHVIGESQKTGEDLKLITGYHLGWNACIDTLEGKNNE